MRTNGFEKPHNLMQISTWILLPILILQYCLFLTPTLPPTISIPLTIIFLSSTIASTYYGYVTTKTDSIDDQLYSHLNNGCPHPSAVKRREKRRKEQLIRKRKEEKRKNKLLRVRSGEDSEDNHDDGGGGTHVASTSSPGGKKKTQDDDAGESPRTMYKVLSAFLPTGATGGKDDVMTSDEDVEVAVNSNLEDNRNNEDDDNDSSDDDDGDDISDTGELKYCWVCQTEVHVHSMHCKYCDKCVSRFDHHCMWLNTCIGAENYPTFYKTVCYTFLMTFIHMISLAIFVTLYFLKDGSYGDVRGRSDRWLNAHTPVLVIGVNIAFLVLLLFVFSMVVQLLSFHNKLRSQGITTYEFIVKDAQDTREKRDLNMRVEDRRRREKIRISNGGHAACCEAYCIGIGTSSFCKRCDPIRKTVIKEMEEENNNDANGSSNGAGNSNGSEVSGNGAGYNVFSSGDDEKEDSEELDSRQLGRDMNGPNGVDSSTTDSISSGLQTKGQSSGEAATTSKTPTFIKV